MANTEVALDWEQPMFHPGTWAHRWPDKPAIIMGESGQTLSYGELERQANQLSQALRRAGLQPGDHVAFSLENRIEFLPILWGFHYAGLYYTAISSRLTADETAYIVNDCGAVAYVTSSELGATAQTVAEATPNLELRLSVGGAIPGHQDLAEFVGSSPAEPLADRREANDMLYSSGTTGRPKGVKLDAPNEPLGSPDRVLMLAAALFGFEPEAVYLSPAPLYHAAPLRFCRAMHRVGGTVVVMERFDPVKALELIERHHVTTSQWVPTMFVRMLKLEPEVRSRYDVSTLQTAVHAAAPCPVPVKEQMIDWWGPVLHEYYAGTEGNGLCYVNSHDWLTHKGTVGTCITGEVHICDPEGNELPVGTEGLVYFGESDFEYHNDPNKTHDSRLPNGWSTLGDIGKVDDEGYLYLTDRKAFMIISGGVNIYPQEIENHLTMHPEVMDVAVIGVPNDDLGEEVKAVVEPRELPTSPEAAQDLVERLQAYCRESLAGFKCPKSIDFRAELPRHPTGKLYKRLLRDEYWAAQPGS